MASHISRSGDICASRGPRVGEEGVPRCAQPIGHPLPHVGYEGSGFEDVLWDDPVFRDSQFAADWAARRS